MQTNDENNETTSSPLFTSPPSLSPLFSDDQRKSIPSESPSDPFSHEQPQRPHSEPIGRKGNLIDWAGFDLYDFSEKEEIPEESPGMWDFRRWKVQWTKDGFLQWEDDGVAMKGTEQQFQEYVEKDRINFFAEQAKKRKELADDEWAARWREERLRKKILSEQRSKFREQYDKKWQDARQQFEERERDAEKQREQLRREMLQEIEAERAKLKQEQENFVIRQNLAALASKNFQPLTPSPSNNNLPPTLTNQPPVQHLPQQPPPAFTSIGTPPIDNLITSNQPPTLPSSSQPLVTNQSQPDSAATTTPTNNTPQNDSSTSQNTSTTQGPLQRPQNNTRTNLPVEYPHLSNTELARQTFAPYFPSVPTNQPEYVTHTAKELAKQGFLWRVKNTDQNTNCQQESVDGQLGVGVNFTASTPVRGATSPASDPRGPPELLTGVGPRSGFPDPSYPSGSHGRDGAPNRNMNAPLGPPLDTSGVPRDSGRASSAAAGYLPGDPGRQQSDLGRANVPTTRNDPRTNNQSTSYQNSSPPPQAPVQSATFSATSQQHQNPHQPPFITYPSLFPQLFPYPQYSMPTPSNPSEPPPPILPTPSDPSGPSPPPSPPSSPDSSSPSGPPPPPPPGPPYGPPSGFPTGPYFPYPPYYGQWQQPPADRNRASGLKIPVFKGTPKENITGWVNVVRGLRQTYSGLSDDIFTGRVIAVLQDRAQVWLQGTAKIFTDPEDLFQSMIDHFGAFGKFSAENEVQSCIQEENEHIRDYNLRFNTKAIAAKKMSESEKVRHYISGLSPALSCKMGSYSDKSLEVCMAVAQTKASNMMMATPRSTSGGDNEFNVFNVQRSVMFAPRTTSIPSIFPAPSATPPPSSLSPPSSLPSSLSPPASLSPTTVQQFEVQLQTLTQDLREAQRRLEQQMTTPQRDYTLGADIYRGNYNAGNPFQPAVGTPSLNGNTGYRNNNNNTRPPGWNICHHCRLPGHWKLDCPSLAAGEPPARWRPRVTRGSPPPPGGGASPSSPGGGAATASSGSQGNI